MIDKNRFFREATMKLFSSLNIQTALKHIQNYLKTYIPMDGIVLSIYDFDRNEGRIIASNWPEAWEKPTSVITVPKELHLYVKETMYSDNDVKIVNDIKLEDPELQELLLSILPENASHMEMDLELDSEKLGFMVIVGVGKNKFSQKHADLISLLHEPFAIAISNILQHNRILELQNLLKDDNTYLNRRLIEISGNTIIGSDFGLRYTMKMVRQVAPLNSPVLLLGETGVGKEVIANAIHSSSDRRDNPLIKVNCGAIPENLIDSELFGHEKGSFTGASSRKRGRFERAHKGTIFLDEVGELPPAAQVRLLRVLQEKEIERVGGTESVKVNVRVISATNRNLEKMIKEGKFREDLWFRLNVFPIIIPPLRQRPEDIPELVNFFIDKKTADLKIRNKPKIAPGSINILKGYHWPGNVRELENIIERVMIQSQASNSNVLKFNWLSSNGKRAEKPIMSLKHGDIQFLDDVISQHIKETLALTDGKIEGSGGAAERLGIHPSTLRGKLRKLNIPFGKKSL